MEGEAGLAANTLPPPHSLSRRARSQAVVAKAGTPAASSPSSDMKASTSEPLEYVKLVVGLGKSSGAGGRLGCAAPFTKTLDILQACRGAGGGHLRGA